MLRLGDQLEGKSEFFFLEGNQPHIKLTYIIESKLILPLKPTSSLKAYTFGRFDDISFIKKFEEAR